MSAHRLASIDVAKDCLDVALRPTEATWSAVNNSRGITALTERLRSARPELVVVETTGGYEARWR